MHKTNFVDILPFFFQLKSATSSKRYLYGTATNIGKSVAKAKKWKFNYYRKKTNTAAQCALVCAEKQEMSRGQCSTVSPGDGSLSVLSVAPVMLITLGLSAGLGRAEAHDL